MQMDGKSMESSHCEEGDLYLEWRFKLNNNSGGTATESGHTNKIPGDAKMVTSRADLVHKLFILLDADGDGFLNAREMYGFALGTGFDGAETEWPVEFRALCADSGANASVGVNEQTLRRLVDDPSDTGCHCTNEELHEMVRNIAPATPPVAAPPGLTLQSASATALQQDFPATRLADGPRRRLVDEVFHLCDRDEDGRLKQHEMLRFAELTGFEGKEEEWDEEYRLLCADHGLDTQLGIGKDEFARLVDDESDAGQYCSVDELKEMLEKLHSEPLQRPPLPDPAPIHERTASVASTAPTLAPMPVAVGLLKPSQQAEPPTTTPASWQQMDTQPPPVEPRVEQNANNSADSGLHTAVAAMPPGFSRDDLLNAVFRALDEDEDGRLNMQEMRVFAGRIGFDGSDGEWSDEFGAICPDDKGISPELFKQLANDTSDEGCYCTTDELRTILRDLFPKVRARRETTAAAEAAAAAAAPQSRPELVRRLFEVCDRDGDQRLNCREFRRFADAIGFEGEDQQWEVEYAALFDGRSERPEAGISFQIFSELVDDMSESGCYCTDEELSTLYAKFSR